MTTHRGFSALSGLILAPGLLLGIASAGCSKAESAENNAFDEGLSDADEDSDGTTGVPNGEGGDVDPDLTPEGGGDSAGDEGSGDDGPDVDPPKFDLGGVPDAVPQNDDERCEKVDFLFVVDNSLSMVDEQNNLVNSFPGFIDEIEDVVAVDDFHIMVVDTDAGSVDGAGTTNCSAGQCSCTSDRCCDILCGGGGSQELTTCNFASCESYPPAADCGKRYGGALTRSGRNGADCGFTSGGRYMDASQPDLKEAFACVATTGSGGSPFEAAMTSTLRSLTTEQEPGGCNEGFLRDDAVLVMTIITDEEDRNKSFGDPDSWYETVVGLKDGNADAVVAIGVFDQSSANLRSFIDKFPRKRQINITDADFSEGFGSAVQIIDTVCDIFDPPE